jgi:hypothetical protein
MDMDKPAHMPNLCIVRPYLPYNFAKSMAAKKLCFFLSGMGKNQEPESEIGDPG